MKQLAGFTVRHDQDDQFIISLEAEGGEPVEYRASAEQVDAVIDTLDEMLTEYEEDAFEVQGEEGQQGA